MLTGGLVATGTAGANPLPASISAPALFNQANADQRAGHLGSAILGYERAHLLAPRDPAIRQNLEVARQKAGVSAPSIAAWERPAHWLSFDGLAGLASISLLLFGLLFFGTRLIPMSLRGLARATGSMFGGIILLCAAAVASRWPELDRAVIVGAQPIVHLAPADNAAAAFPVKTGEVVNEEEHYGNFVRIRSADGRSGWVPRAEVQRVIPDTSKSASAEPFTKVIFAKGPGKRRVPYSPTIQPLVFRPA